MIYTLTLHDALPIFEFAARAGGLGPGVVNVDGQVVAPKLVHHVDNAAVAYVGAVFLEGQGQNQHAGAGPVDAAFGHKAQHFTGHVAAHAVVGAASGQDHFGVKAALLGLVGQVVRVHADAVAADQAGLKGQEIPFGGGGVEYGGRVQAQVVEQHGQLVDKGEIGRASCR